MNSFELIIENCPIIKINNENYVIDNCVPYSFCYEKEKEINIDGKLFHFKKDVILLDFFANFKTKIDGVIGLDILNSFPGLTINVEKNSFYFEALPKKDFISMPCNNYFINIQINNKSANAMMDFVAKKHYCSKDYIDNSKCKGSTTETTLLGKIDFDIYETSIKALSKNLKIDTLVIPDDLFNKVKADALINPLTFINRYLSINYKDKTLYFE